MVDNMSSAARVVADCDDLLIQVLVRLPKKSVIRFKRVSKRWNRLISDPFFKNYYRSCNPRFSLPLGFFQFPGGTMEDLFGCHQSDPPLHHQIQIHPFLSTTKEGKFMKHCGFIHDPAGFFIAASPQGLILWGHSPMTFTVIDPCTNQCLKLPSPKAEYPDFTVGFSSSECSDTGQTIFKVIRAKTQRSISLSTLVPIETFSSETCTWKESVLISPFEIAILPFWCSAVNGTFFWQTQNCHIAVYDSNILGENHLRLIRLPAKGGNPGFIVGNIGQLSDGRFQCAVADEYGMQIWVLRKSLCSYGFSTAIPSTEWRSKGIINFRNRNLINYNSDGQAFISDRYPRLIAFHPHDPQLVYLQLVNKIFSYHLSTRKLQRISYQGRLLLPINRKKLFPYFLPSRSQTNSPRPFL